MTNEVQRAFLERDIVLKIDFRVKETIKIAVSYIPYMVTFRLNIIQFKQID